MKVFRVNVVLNIEADIPVCAESEEDARNWVGANGGVLKRDWFEIAETDITVHSATRMVEPAELAHHIAYGDGASEQTVERLLAGITLAGWEAALVEAGWTGGFFRRSRRASASIEDTGLLSPCGRWAANGDVTHVPTGFLLSGSWLCPAALSELSELMGPIEAVERAPTQLWMASWRDALGNVRHWTPA